MSLRHLLQLVLLAVPATTNVASAAGFSCDFTQYCAGTAPCVTLESPMIVELDPAFSGFTASVDGTDISESPFRFLGEAREDQALFLAAEQSWAGWAERWLLSILPDGTARMTVHRTQAFGEFETRAGICRRKQ